MLSNLHPNSLVKLWTNKNESLIISPLLVACIISDDILAVCGLKTIGPDLQIDFAATWLSFPGRVWQHLFFLLLRFFLCFFFLDFFLHFVQIAKNLCFYLCTMARSHTYPSSVQNNPLLFLLLLYLCCHHLCW